MNTSSIRTYILYSLALFGFIKLIMSGFSLSPVYSIGKDFTQEYLMGKAVLNGLDPYMPLPQLEEFFPLPGRPELFEHPSAHPPVSALLGLPFALLPYLWAAGFWFALELILIFFSCYLLLRWWNVTKIVTGSLVFFFIIFCWEPIYAEVFTGQLNTFLLPLIILGWTSLRKNEQIWGGIFLGSAIAIKLFLWPVYLLLIFRKQWRAAFSSTIAFVLLNLAVIPLIGGEALLRYYATTNTTVWPIWRSHEANFSTWSLGWRIFEGTHGRGEILTIIPPILHSETYAQFISFTIPILTLLIGIYLLTKTKGYDHAYSMTICLSILLSPIAWSHYLILTLVPLTILAKQLSLLDASFRDTHIVLLALGTTILLISPGYNLGGLSYVLSRMDITSAGEMIIVNLPFYAILFTLIPLFALFLLITLIYRIDKVVVT